MLSSTTPDNASTPKPSFSEATVADVMHQGIVYCEADTPLWEAARRMSADRVHCIAVHATAYDESGEDRVWGIVSDVDLVRAGVSTNIDRPAGTIAHTPVITVMPSTALAEAGEVMLAHDVSHVVVVDPDTQRPVGMLSTLDIAGALARGN